VGPGRLQAERSLTMSAGLHHAEHLPAAAIPGGVSCASKRDEGDGAKPRKYVKYTPEWRNKNLLPEKSVARGCKPLVTEEAEVTASTLPGVPQHALLAATPCSSRVPWLQEDALGMQSSSIDELLPEPVLLDPRLAGSGAAAAAVYQPEPTDFQCSNPQCKRLLARPLVPVCGHPVCRCVFCKAGPNARVQLRWRVESRAMQHAGRSACGITAGRFTAGVALSVRGAWRLWRAAAPAARCATSPSTRRPPSADRQASSQHESWPEQGSTAWNFLWTVFVTGNVGQCPNALYLVSSDRDMLCSNLPCNAKHVQAPQAACQPP